MRSLALMAVLVSLGSSAAPGTAAAPSLDAALGKALRAPGIATARTGAIVVDADTGATLYAHNSTASLLPASVEKLAVSYTALHVLGPGFRFRTELVGVGLRSGRVWHGSLGLVGYGDPTLRRADLDRLARRFADTRDPTRSGARLRRRHVLRLAARRARLEAVVRRHRVAAALRTLGGGRAVRGHERLGSRRAPGLSPSRFELAASP